MAILIVTRSTPLHANSGGMEEVAWELAKELNKTQKVDVLTTSLPEYPGDFFHEGIRVWTIPGTVPGRYSWKWWRRTASWQGDGDYSSVLSVSAGATSMVWLNPRQRFVFQAHGTASSELKSILASRPRLWVLKAARMSAWTVIDRLTYLRVAVVVAVSPSVAKKLSSPSLRGVWDKTKLRVVENGVDVSLFRDEFIPRQEARERFGFDSSDRVVLTMSRLTRQKGVDQAIAGIARSDAETKLLVVGEGPEQNTLKALVEQSGLGDRVVFSGRLNREGVRFALSAADSFLFPVRDAQREGLPIAVLEALAAGLPVVVPLDSEWQEDLTPMLIFTDVSDPELLSDSIERSVDACKTFLPSKFTTEAMATAYAKLLGNV